MQLKQRIEHDPLAAYFVLAYGITWAGTLLVIASTGFHLERIGLAHFVLIFLAMIAGPSTASLGLTWLLDGPAGLQSLAARVLRPRAAGRWVVVATFIMPVIAWAIFAALGVLVSRAFQPGFVPLGLVFGLLAGIFEELGWSGFALPRLLTRRRAFPVGLGLGLAWAVWHLLADFSGNMSTQGTLWPLNFALYWIVPLTAYRILMVWVYQNTQSLLLMQLMHAFYTGSLAVLSPQALPLADSFIWKLALGLALWGIVAIVVRWFGADLKRPSGHAAPSPSPAASTSH